MIFRALLLSLYILSYNEADAQSAKNFKDYFNCAQALKKNTDTSSDEDIKIEVGSKNFRYTATTVELCFPVPNGTVHCGVNFTEEALKKLIYYTQTKLIALNKSILSFPQKREQQKPEPQLIRISQDVNDALNLCRGLKGLEREINSFDESIMENNRKYEEQINVSR